MVAQPDTTFVTGPDYIQLTAGNVVITPTGGSQTTLGSALSPSGGGLQGATVAAAGTNQSTAIALRIARNYVESGTGGVQLPQGATFGNAIIPVYNRSGATITVYPYFGDTIEANAVNAGVTLSNNQTGYFSVDPSGVVRMA